jgi:hypothetical protein
MVHGEAKHLPKSVNYDRLAGKLTTDKLAAFIKRHIRLVLKSVKH